MAPEVAPTGDRLAARSKESRKVGGSIDRDESEVAVTPNQSAPRWKVTTLTARGNWRRASRHAAPLVEAQSDRRRRRRF